MSEIINWDPRVITSHPEYVLASLGPVLVGIWRGACDVPRTRETLQALRVLADKYPGKCVYMPVVEPSSPNLEGDTRRLAKDEITALGSKMLGMAVVYEGKGVRQSAIRLIMSGISAFSDATKTFATVTEAQRWISTVIPALPVTFNSDVERLRSSMAKAA